MQYCGCPSCQYAFHWCQLLRFVRRARSMAWPMWRSLTVRGVQCIRQRATPYTIAPKRGLIRLFVYSGFGNPNKKDPSFSQYFGANVGWMHFDLLRLNLFFLPSSQQRILLKIYLFERFKGMRHLIDKPIYPDRLGTGLIDQWIGTIAMTAVGEWGNDGNIIIQISESSNSTYSVTQSRGIYSYTALV